MNAKGCTLAGRRYRIGSVLTSEGKLLGCHEGKWVDIPHVPKRRDRLSEVVAQFSSIKKLPSKDQPAAIFFLEELLLMAANLALGYVFGDPKQGQDQALAETNERLVDIQRSLKDANAKLDEIAERLKHLVDEIRGAFREELLGQWVTSQNSAIESLLPKLTDLATFRANRSHVQQLCDRLAETVNQVFFFSDAKIVGCLLAAPGIAIWAQAQELLFGEPDLFPSRPSVKSTPFHRKNMDRYKGFFLTLRGFKETASWGLVNTPNISTDERAKWLYLHGYGQFVYDPAADPVAFRAIKVNEEVKLIGSWWEFVPGGKAKLVWRPIDDLNLHWGFADIWIAELRQRWPSINAFREQLAYSFQYVDNSQDAENMFARVADWDYIPQYMAICTEAQEHGGEEFPLSSWEDDLTKANEAGKLHEQLTKGHRWRIAVREKPIAKKDAKKVPNSQLVKI